MQGNQIGKQMMIGLLASGAAAAPALAADVIKADNTNNLDQISSWVGGSVPGSGDVAAWDSTVTGGQTLSLGSNLGWSGIKIDGSVGGNITISLGNTLTLGAAGFTNTASRTITLNNAITLSADQAWNSSTGAVIPAGGVDTAGYALTLLGGGTLQFKKDITGGGALVVGHSNTKFTSGAKAAGSDVTILGGAAITLDSGGSAAGLTRMQSLTLDGVGINNNGAQLTADESGTAANTIDTIAGALTIARGFGTIQIRPKSGYRAELDFGSFSRAPGALVSFNGTGLAANNAGTGAGSTNILFGAAPGLVGGDGSHTTDGKILKGAIGDSTYGGGGFSATGGLVTYDATRGVRVLGASEYATSITNGQTQLDNVLLSNGSGSASAVTLNSDTTINSLSLNVTAAASPITIAGTGTLKLNSGTLYAWSASPATAGAEMTINSTLDLNGTEGIFQVSTNGSSNGLGGALLEMSGVITNDGGKGLTIGGNRGVIEMSGSASNTYTGTTTISSNGVSVRLAKTNAIAIPGNLVINSGTVQNTNNQIADSADITINGGSLLQKGGPTNSGTGANETFHDLLMTGGSYGDGATGTSSGTTNLHSATLTGGTWTVTGGHKTNLSGSLNANGGAISINGGPDASRTTIMTIAGNLLIANTGADAYAPITVNGGGAAGKAGGQIDLFGNVQFTGNATNPNTVTVAAVAPASGGGDGTITLEGTRTFNIGNGAAADDLAIQPVLANGASAGGLIKSGAGTLVLSGVNTYTGPTRITAAALKLDATGSIAASASITISDGATLDTTEQSFSMLNSQPVTFSLNPAGSGSAGLLSAGALDISNGHVEFTLAGTLDDPAYLLASYSSLSGSTFASALAPSGYKLDYNYLNSGQIALVVVPEPSMLGLVAAGGLALLARRRRRLA